MWCFVFIEFLISRQGSTNRGLEVFLGIMMAGFAGNTSSMISATVVSLGRILFEYGELCFTVCPQLLETVALLLRHRAREVVGAAVGFIKVAVVKLPPAMIDSFLPGLIPALLGWSTEARRCCGCSIARAQHHDSESKTGDFARASALCSKN